MWAAGSCLRQERPLVFLCPCPLFLSSWLLSLLGERNP